MSNQDDDARATTKSGRREPGSRVVVFDEDNLRQNKEWHDAHPVTMHIDEPKTPYCTDDGEYEDEDQKQLDEDREHRAHLQQLTEQNTQHNKSVGSGNRPSAAAGTAQPAARQNQNDNDDASSASPVREDAGESTTSTKTHHDGWTDAAYNKIGSEALRNQPLTFTSVAPSTNTEGGEGDINSGNKKATIPPNKNSNEDTAALTADTFTASGHLKKPPVGLKLGAFSEEEQEKAEKARHDAEFKTMRKAVYRDEGLKFREMMKAAQQKALEEEEEEDVDQD